MILRVAAGGSCALPGRSAVCGALSRITPTGACGTIRAEIHDGLERSKLVFAGAGVTARPGIGSRTAIAESLVDETATSGLRGHDAANPQAKTTIAVRAPMANQTCFLSAASCARTGRATDASAGGVSYPTAEISPSARPWVSTIPGARQFAKSLGASTVSTGCLGSDRDLSSRRNSAAASSMISGVIVAAPAWQARSNALSHSELITRGMPREYAAISFTVAKLKSSPPLYPA